MVRTGLGGMGGAGGGLLGGDVREPALGGSGEEGQPVQRP